MRQTKKRQSFTKEFKLEAVRLATNSDKPKTRVAEDLGISDVTLYKWCKAYQAKQTQGFQETGPTTEQHKIRNLQVALERVTEERDIFKKAVVYFARARPVRAMTSPLSTHSDHDLILQGFVDYCRFLVVDTIDGSRSCW